MKSITVQGKYGLLKKPSLLNKKALVFLIPLLLAACDNGSHPEAQQTPPANVETLTVSTEPFKMQAELPGRIEPVRVAEVRARVAGIVLSRNFEEGSLVKAGQVLFQIDSAPFRAALSRAQGGLERAEADLSDAQAVLRRYEPLVKIDAVSHQDFDNARTTLKTAMAARQTAMADVQTAKLNLDYATVKAPISGRIGRAMVTEGALVGQNEATPLATIQQIDSVYADFRQPVAEALRLRKELSDGHLSGSDSNQTELALTVEGSDEKRTGHLLFSDITVDRNTGQFLMRGEFPNPDGYLLPGMYVRIHVTQATNPKALLIPQRAVQISGDGAAQVMVVGKDNSVEARQVSTGEMSGSRWVITKGLNAGDKVIIGGTVNPGMQVASSQPEPPTGDKDSENLSTAKN